MLAAVIVTYNRKEELCRNLDMLYAQTVAFDRIIVVDNCSSDGTKEHLIRRGYLLYNNFDYFCTETNIGGAGGFYVGLQRAFESGANEIVLMDDDGRPCDEHTIQFLVDHVKAQRQAGVADGKMFVNSLVICGDRLTSKIEQMALVSEAEAAAENGVLVGAAHPFNGTLVTRELVSEIGYPNKDFFIKGDEVDFKQRAFDASAYVATLTDSKYYHPIVPTQEKYILGKLVPVCVEAPWKEYYVARNLTYTYKKKKHYKMIAFELVFVKLYAIMTMPCKKWKTIRYLAKGLWDGWRGKLGPTVKP